LGKKFTAVEEGGADRANFCVPVRSKKAKKRIWISDCIYGSAQINTGA